MNLSIPAIPQHISLKLHSSYLTDHLMIFMCVCVFMCVWVLHSLAVIRSKLVVEEHLSALARDAGSVIAAMPARLWVKLCLRRSQFRRNTLPQAKQLYGLMSVWVSRWVFRFERWLKLRLHTGHLCGDSSMCKILCTARVRDWQKPLPHSVHLNGFSFEWMYLKNRRRRGWG